MLVRDRMTTTVCTISPDTSLEQAGMLMRSRHIRRLPVLEGGRLVGIVTWTDLMRAQPSPATTLGRWEILGLLEKTAIRGVMTRFPEVVGPETGMEEAAAIMRRRKIGALPVVRDGNLVGIITESDVFDALIDLLGVRRPSYRITLDVEDNSTALPDITAAFRLLVLRLYSLSTYPAEPGRLRVVVRVEPAMPLRSLVEALGERGLRTVHATDGESVVIEVAVSETLRPAGPDRIGSRTDFSRAGTRV
jgi:acetoin utilization protein AcuB